MNGIGYDKVRQKVAVDWHKIFEEMVKMERIDDPKKE